VADAVEFLEKPFDDARLLNVARQALEQSRQLLQTEAVVAAAARLLATPTPRDR
jgi:FixJ family two-component response regulator